MSVIPGAQTPTQRNHVLGPGQLPLGVSATLLGVSRLGVSEIPPGMCKMGLGVFRDVWEFWGPGWEFWGAGQGYLGPSYVCVSVEMGYMSALDPTLLV